MHIFVKSTLYVIYELPIQNSSYLKAVGKHPKLLMTVQVFNDFQPARELQSSIILNNDFDVFMSVWKGAVPASERQRIHQHKK